MKLTTIVLATAFALSGTAAFANTVHHKAAVRADHDAVGMVQLHSNYGNPNGNPDGPTTLSGTGDSSFGGSSAGTSGYNQETAPHLRARLSRQPSGRRCSR